MKKSRRNFIKNTSLGIIAMSSANLALYAKSTSKSNSTEEIGALPWIELSRKAYLKNIGIISKITDNRSIIAVLKNNAYGLGDIEVATILENSKNVRSYALVKDTRCIALRKNGIKKDILLMGDFSKSLGSQLVKNDVTLSVFSHESFSKIKSLAKNYSKKIKVQLYFDTGLGRMGMPYYKSLRWVKELSEIPNVFIEGAYSTLTTPKDFAIEQINRFRNTISKLNNMGISINLLHIAPSQSALEIEQSHLDCVRPGILLHGTLPLVNMPAYNDIQLAPTFRLRAPVIRVEKLKKGDTIGFSRFYELKQDEWIATLPIGWADGYYSGAENGAKVLIHDSLFDVVNVNASHCNILVGLNKKVNVGDIATLIGTERSEITPEGFSKLANGHNYLQINYKESLPKIIVDEFN